jgi:D-aminoacyl-tRNA deacylase
MRAVVQRVSRAQVSVGGELVARIERGLCVFVGVAREDSDEDARTLADKIVGLRVFEDDAGRMNVSLAEIAGAILAISQFTLLGDVRKGKRPSFSTALEPVAARALFERFCELCRRGGVPVEQGRFREHMLVELTNDGPVTILIDTKRTF